MKTCHYFPVCQGCAYWDIPYSEQTKMKAKKLQSLFAESHIRIPEISFITCGEHGLRQRVDFTITNESQMKMGFYDQSKNLVDIEHCLQLSPQLQDLYNEFRKIHFPISKGSVRLRVGPNGLRGCWLDFSNLDVKNLLSEQTTLMALKEKNILVEVGQKGKVVRFENHQFKLRDPKPQIWFETYDSNGNPIPILGLVSDFTQPSWQTAAKLVECVLQWNEKFNISKHVIEFGPGLGQFTLSLLKEGFAVSAFETEASAIEALNASATANGISQNLNTFVGDFQNKGIDQIGHADLVLVNPPRSGLKKFTHEILRLNCKHCIYISCFPESMVTDLKILTDAGFKVLEVKIVDQFPQTKHFETCILLQKLSQ